MSWDAVLIAGPTASGKSALALDLADEIGGTIINTDSMQVYSELRILTARPNARDEARVPHLLYGHKSVTQRYSVGRYLEDAAGVASDLARAGRVPIFVGGSGLYFNALTEGLSPIPEISPQVRDALEKRLAAIGLPAFFAEFSEQDPETMAGLNPNDRQRVLRAASVFVSSGRSLKKWQEVKGTSLLEWLDVLRVVLAPPRELLHTRIDIRFHQMIAGGAIGEVRALGQIDPGLPAARALGLPQLQAHLRGEIDLEEAVNQAVAETRRYAKRQMTWFRRFMIDWKWLENGNLRNIMS
nr:MAG: tRNA (adenosine(37)-N6)-dimethylallyltransferase MiaA [Hyphomicrobiales bacterium]